MDGMIWLLVVVVAALAAFGVAALRLGGVAAAAAALTGTLKPSGAGPTVAASTPPAPVLATLADARQLAQRRAAEEGRAQAILVAPTGYQVVAHGDARATPGDTLELVEPNGANQLHAV
jgi:hypothetical protein